MSAGVLVEEPVNRHATGVERARTASSFGVRRVERSELTVAFLESWRDLESRSCHSNAFLSPDFFVPAWRLLPARDDAFLMAVSERDTGRLMALGAFSERIGNHILPLPHLQAAQTMHTFRTGILVDASEPRPSLKALLEFVRSQGWQGVVLPKMRLDSNLARHLAGVTKTAEYSWQTVHTATSPAVFPPVLTRESADEALSGSRRKSLRRSRSWLETLGPVRLVTITDSLALGPALQEFLRLEDSGWKGDQHTSLLSSRSEAQFLEVMGRQMFQSGRLMLTQLKVGERVAATAVNFLNGNTLFAFKIAWNPEFAKGSPGMLHEYELMHLVREQFPDVTCIDSCARPDSYVASIWPHEIDVGRAVIGLTPWARTALKTLDVVRSVRAKIFHRPPASQRKS